MSWIDTATSFLNPVMHPLLQIHPLLAVAVVSCFIALFNAWVYKIFTDQHKMKALKEDMKRMQNEVRKYKDNSSKMLEVQSEMMKKNLDYMKQSFKPTLITMIPVLIILGWMTGHLAYDPIHPSMPVNVTVFLQKAEVGTVQLQVPFGMEIIGNESQDVNNATHSATWEVEGAAGTYNMDFIKDGEKVTQQIIISNDQVYAKPVVPFSGSASFVQGQIHNNSKVIINVFGLFNLGYLLTYFICAICFSLGIRKLMGLH